MPEALEIRESFLKPYFPWHATSDGDFANDGFDDDEFVSEFTSVTETGLTERRRTNRFRTEDAPKHDYVSPEVERTSKVRHRRDGDLCIWEEEVIVRRVRHHARMVEVYYEDWAIELLVDRSEFVETLLSEARGVTDHMSLAEAHWIGPGSTPSADDVLTGKVRLGFRSTRSTRLGQEHKVGEGWEPLEYYFERPEPVGEPEHRWMAQGPWHKCERTPTGQTTPTPQETLGRVVLLDLHLDGDTVDPGNVSDRVARFAGQVAASMPGSEPLPDTVVRLVQQPCDAPVDAATLGNLSVQRFIGSVVVEQVDPAAVERGATVVLASPPITGALALGDVLDGVEYATLTLADPHASTEAVDAAATFVDHFGINRTVGPAGTRSGTPENVIVRRRNAIDRLPGERIVPLTQPLHPDAETLKNQLLDGLRASGLNVGNNYTVTEARIDDNGKWRVSISIPIGADGKPVKPISARTAGDPGATTLLQVTAFERETGGTWVPSTEAYTVDVTTNRITTANRVDGADHTTSAKDTVAPIVKGGVVPQPWRTGPKYEPAVLPGPTPTATTSVRSRRWALVAIPLAVIGVIVAAVLVFAGGGGDDDTTSAVGSKNNRTKPQTGVAGAAPTTPIVNLATANLPGTITFAATKTATVVPPTNGVAPVPVGRVINGTLPVVSSCQGTTCTFTSAYNPGTGQVRGPVPQVTWARQGSAWHVTTSANILSSSTGGAECVYTYSDTWDLTPTAGARQGTQTIGTALTGTLRREAHMNPSLSASGIAAKTCIGYDQVDDWSVQATGA